MHRYSVSLRIKEFNKAKISEVGRKICSLGSQSTAESAFGTEPSTSRPTSRTISLCFSLSPRLAQPLHLTISHELLVVSLSKCDRERGLYIELTALTELTELHPVPVKCEK